MIRRKFCLFMAWLGFERKQTTCKTGRRKSSVRSYTAFARQQIRAARQREAFCTARNYLTALNSFTVFCRTEEITFPMVTAQRMEDYQAWLRHQGICLNTISCYMRSLRAVYNKGKRQCNSRRGDPFAKVFTGNAVTQKRALDKATVDRLRTASPRARQPATDGPAAVPLQPVCYGDGICRYGLSPDGRHQRRVHHLQTEEDRTDHPYQDRALYADRHRRTAPGGKYDGVPTAGQRQTARNTPPVSGCPQTAQPAVESCSKGSRHHREHHVLHGKAYMGYPCP